MCAQGVLMVITGCVHTHALAGYFPHSNYTVKHRENQVEKH